MIPKFLSVCLLLVACNGASLAKNEEGEERLTDVKHSLQTLNERMDRWDSVYLTRLEPRMIGAATSLANLDSNIKNLQERAHVWDTFQLHVAAWNDQIKDLDNKLRIVAKGNEKIESIEQNLKSVSVLYETISTFNEKLNGIGEQLHNITGKDLTSSVQEFSDGKMLHALKVLENKIDRVLMNIDRIQKSNWGNRHIEELKQASDLEDVVRDISSKVDLLYDNSERGNQEVELIDVDSPLSHDDLSKSCKKLTMSYRRIINHLISIEAFMNDLNTAIHHGGTELSTTTALSVRGGKYRKDKSIATSLKTIKSGIDEIEDDLEKLAKEHDRDVDGLETSLKKIDKKLNNVIRDDRSDDRDIAIYFKRQRNFIRDVVTKNTNRAIKILREEIEEVDDDDTKERKSKRRRKNNKDDTDEDDDDDTDESKKDDTDEDDDDTDESKKDDTDEDDDDTDESKKNDTDEDDDDDDDTKERKSSRRKNKKNDTDEDDTDEDDDDTDESKKDDTDEDDDDDDDTKEKKSSRRKNKKNDTNEDDTDEDDDDTDEDTRERKSKRKNKKNDTDEDDDTDESKSKKDDDTDEDDDDDDDTKERNSRRKNKKDDTDEDDDDDDDTKEKKSRRKNRKNDSNDDDDDNDTKERKSKKRKNDDSDEDDNDSDGKRSKRRNKSEESGDDSKEKDNDKNDSQDDDSKDDDSKENVIEGAKLTVEPEKEGIPTEKAQVQVETKRFHSHKTAQLNSEPMSRSSASKLTFPNFF